MRFAHKFTTISSTTEIGDNMSNRQSIDDMNLSVKNKKSKSIFSCRPVKYVCLSVAVAAVGYANYMVKYK
ncbi:hypothetical protein PFUGPA_03515 [Plasmodium falciparum Palo Alto/Uganda]|uniref:Uncharacterized protein n=2 Tax=Plasmodium falciparum TaxID=5833 RepID=W4IWB9_PLAFP|nr:hypothetical protein PFFCH_05155 [Plasmodium falciparum FCH/4]ETW53641.1 hypothetical protein PFUGPA_03515 [Plasmodium falciparum Palo Alto/Uganda]